MTVDQLMIELAALPPEMEVRFWYDTGHDHLLIRGVKVINQEAPERFQHWGGFYGDHVLLLDDWDGREDEEKP